MNTANQTAPDETCAKPEQTRGDKIAYAAFLCGSVFLCVMLGVVLSVMNAAPYRWTKDAASALDALITQQKMLAEEFPSHNWQTARFEEKGLTNVSHEISQQGYTLHGSGGGTRVSLLDMNGKEVHSWDAPFSKVWPKPSFAKSMVPGSRIHVRRAHVFANGDLLAQYATTFATPSGIGIARINSNSEVLWSYDGNCHHDFTLDDSGNVYVLTHELIRSSHPRSKFGNEINIEDFVTVLSPHGEFVKKISLLDALFDSPFYRPKVLVRDKNGDILHANTVNLVEQEFASHHEAVDAGDLMVCFRNVNLVCVLEPETGKIVWATNGPWHFPHDPDPLDNGNILIFDNCVTRGTTVCSRVLEYNPATGEVAWEFAGTSDQPLRSDIRSTQQLLPNGNVLICESDGGRIIEVTREGKIAWQYINPARGGEQDQLIPIMTGVHRYQVHELEFLGSTTNGLLTAGK